MAEDRYLRGRRKGKAHKMFKGQEEGRGHGT
jgi:hypothetical protein